VFVTHQLAATKVQERVKNESKRNPINPNHYDSDDGLFCLKPTLLALSRQCIFSSNVDDRQDEISAVCQGVSKLQGEAYDFVLATGYQYFERQA